MCVFIQQLSLKILRTATVQRYQLAVRHLLARVRGEIRQHIVHQQEETGALLGCSDRSLGEQLANHTEDDDF